MYVTLAADIKKIICMQRKRNYTDLLLVETSTMFVLLPRLREIPDPITMMNGLLSWVDSVIALGSLEPPNKSGKVNAQAVMRLCRLYK